MIKPTHPVVRYFGGKWTLAPWIIQYFPAHTNYVEPYCGAASVFMRKDRSKVEVLNDLDNRIYNLFTVLRNPEQSKELIRRLKLTPYSRVEYEEAWNNQDPDCQIEKARIFILLCRFSFNTACISKRHKSGFRSVPHGHGRSPACSFVNSVNALSLITERLESAIIENTNGLNLIKKWNKYKNTLFYIDPPYLRSLSNKNTHTYLFDMNEMDHKRLLEVLLNVNSMIVLSGYPNELYDDMLSDWHRVERDHYAGGNNGGRLPRTEVLWINQICWKKLKSQEFKPFND